jgi:hypothetical protein
MTHARSVRWTDERDPVARCCMWGLSRLQAVHPNWQWQWVYWMREQKKVGGGEGQACLEDAWAGTRKNRVNGVLKVSDINGAGEANPTFNLKQRRTEDMFVDSSRWHVNTLAPFQFNTSHRPAADPFETTASKTTATHIFFLNIGSATE